MLPLLTTPPIECPRGARSVERRLRVAFYSHDTVGLGHLRRNLLLAQRLGSSPLRAETLVIAGGRQASLLAGPQRHRCVALPALCKREAAYASAGPGSLAEVSAARARRIEQAIEAFRPDVLVVDKVPRGALGELEPTLELLRRRGTTSCVLGLRDILDEASVARREWSQADNDAAVRRWYDAVWVYGDRRVLDVAEEYALPADVAARIRYAGYLDRRVTDRASRAGARSALAALDLPERFVLCALGGGEDGARLADAFSRVSFSRGLHGVVLAGPLMPTAERRELHRRAAANPRLRVVDFLREPAELMRRAERVISMGGYNTVCEILAYEKRALVVPRTTPRREQWVRAQRMQALGLLDVCAPEQLSPESLEQWLARECAQADRRRIDLGALDRLPGLVQGLPGAARRPAVAPLAA